MTHHLGLCDNPRCLEPLRSEDRATLPWLAPAGFCPCCRLAIAIGFRHGASLVAVVSVVIAAIVALVRYFA